METKMSLFFTSFSSSCQVHKVLLLLSLIFVGYSSAFINSNINLHCCYQPIVTEEYYNTRTKFYIAAAARDDDDSNFSKKIIHQQPIDDEEEKLLKEPQSKNQSCNNSSTNDDHRYNKKEKQHKLHQELEKLKRKKRYKYKGGNRSRGGGGAQLAEERLMEVVKLWQQDSSQILLTDRAFNIVIMGYAHEAKYDISAPMKAESLLQKMCDELDGITPSRFTYNAVIQAWSASSLKYKTLRPYHAIVRLMGEMQTLGGFEPDTFTYNLVMASNLPKAKKWLTTMKKKQIPPDRQTYHWLFKSYSQDGTKAEEAEALVDELFLITKKKENNSSNIVSSDTTTDLRPHAVWINCVISALAKSSSPNRGEKADACLMQMQKLYRAGQANMRPDSSTYSKLINVHASLQNEKRVEELLEELEHQYAGCSEPELQPTVVTYTTAMKTYKPDKALKLLEKMKTLAAKENRPNVRPNIVTYNTLIKLLVSSSSVSSDGRESANYNKNNMFRAMHLFDESKEVGLGPNSATYAELIFGWSASGVFEAGYQAQELLQELESLPLSQQKGVEMTKLYNAVIFAWGRSSPQNTNAVQRAEELLDLMERKCDVAALMEGKAVSELVARTTEKHTITTTCCPNIVTFISVADAYAKARVVDAEERCDALLKRMKRLGITPTRVLYNSILNALAKSCQGSAVKKAEEILKLMDDDVDIVTYSTIVDCYTKCGEEAFSTDTNNARNNNNNTTMSNTIAKADETLRTVETTYEATRDLRFKPTPVFYSAILQAYAKSASLEGADKAEKLLRKNEQLFHSDPVRYDYCKPHAILYNAVIDAIARSGCPDSGQQAELLLQEIELNDDINSSFRITRRTLNAVLLAYRNDHQNGGYKAEYILKRMEELTNAGVYDVMPDVIAWNTAIGAIAKSNDPTAAERAYALFQQMKQATSEGQQDNNNDEILSRSKRSTTNQISRSVRPDGITYAYVIEAWLKRNDKKGTDMAQQLLDEFYSILQEQKKKGNRSNPSSSRLLKPDPVWNVIQAYQKREGGDNLLSTSIAKQMN